MAHLRGLAANLADPPCTVARRHRLTVRRESYEIRRGYGTHARGGWGSSRVQLSKKLCTSFRDWNLADIVSKRSGGYMYVGRFLFSNGK